jgi:L-ascorbate metabolism protein UlaG (beta-lactamase superfamily)
MRCSPQSASRSTAADADAEHLAHRGLEVVPLELGIVQPFLGGRAHLVPAMHGHGWIGRAMGAGVGYVLSVPGHPSLYLSGDTVLTPDVEAALSAHRPEVSVVHAGGASLDFGPPILMSLEEVVRFVRLAPGAVFATHLEALNHCPTTRAMLSEALQSAGLLGKVRIPMDGEALTFDESR